MTWLPTPDRISPSSLTKVARPVKSATVAGNWAGLTCAGAAAGAGSSARASSASARRMRCWSAESSGRGSTPSSSARSRRVSAYTARASACRPLRYRASMRSSRRRSCSGCAAVRAVSSETASAWWPSSRSRSRRVSSSWRCHSASRVRSVSACGPGTPASGSPSHRSRARASSVRARVRSPAVRARSASAARLRATPRSRAPAGVRMA